MSISPSNKMMCESTVDAGAVVFAVVVFFKYELLKEFLFEDGVVKNELTPVALNDRNFIFVPDRRFKQNLEPISVANGTSRPISPFLYAVYGHVRVLQAYRYQYDHRETVRSRPRILHTNSDVPENGALD